MTSNNVVMFTKGKKDSPPQSYEELITSVMQTRSHHVEFLASEFADFIIYRSFEESFDLTKEAAMRATHFMKVAITSALFAAAGLDHPLHELIDEFVTEEVDAEAEPEA